MRIRNWVLLLAPALLFGQPISNVVSVTASNSSNVQPDQAIFAVTVSSGIDKNLSDIVDALAGAGITAANLQTVNSAAPVWPNFSPSPQPAIAWIFQLIAPLTKVKDTTTTLTQLQKTIVQANNGLTLSFSITGTQISQLQACDLAILMNQARTQAQKIAGSAGLSPGAIVGITNSISNSAPLCSLTVRFALGGMIGQPGPNSITITAARTTNTPPDQALIRIGVTSALTASLDDITATLSGAGITGASFTGGGTSTIYVTNGNQTQPQSVLSWSFTLTAPLSGLKNALAPLPAAQQTIAKQNSGMALSFSVAGTQLSAQAQQAQPCPESDLMSDARTQAEKVAVAAGVTAGAVLSISSTNPPATTVAAISPVLVPASAALTPDLGNPFPGLAGFLLGYPGYSPIAVATAPGCGLTVQFQLE